MADYESGAIYFTGLGSGTDFDTIIDATISAESYRLELMEEQEETLELQVEYLQEVNSAVLDLSTILDTMDSVSDFLVKEATSTSTSLGVSADGDASVESHTVTVNQLAQTDVLVGDSGYSSTDDSINSTSSNATFVYSYGGVEHSIDVAAGTTLEELADLITDFDETEGDVRASTVYDGSSYYLKIYGMDLGADYPISISSNSSPAGFSSSDFTNTQEAQNAQLKVDGWPTGADDWIERSTNSIDDVIDGVTLTLYETCEDATVNVTLNSDSIEENVESLVDALNTVFSYIDALTAVDEDGEGSTFTGNYGVRLAEQLLKQATSSQPAGFDYYDSDTGLGDLYSSLSQIGITTDADEDSDTFGLLVIDYDDLEAALDEDPDAVALLFAADGEGESLSSDFSFVSAVAGITEGGEYAVEYEVSGGTIVWATIDGVEAVVEGLEITADSGDASGLTVSVDNTVDGTYSGEATVKQGIVTILSEVASNLISSDDGLFQIMEDSYDDQLDALVDRIEAETERLDDMETRLREKYASLEATLGEYEDIGDQLDSSLAALDS